MKILDKYGPAPALGMITFVDTTKTRKKRDPGRCYLRAGAPSLAGIWQASQNRANA